MTTGTTDPYLEEPEDINPPKPGSFHDVFHLVHAYIELLSHIPENRTGPPGKGLIKLYSYRMGTLDLDTTVLEQSYAALVGDDRGQQKRLLAFADSAIAYNIQAYYRLIANTLSRDLARGFGDSDCLSSELILALNLFAKLQVRTDTDAVRRYDSMDALVQACHTVAYFRHPGVSSSQAIIRAIAALDPIVNGEERIPDTVTPRHRLLNALKIIFYIGCRYYHLNLLRFSDEIIKRSYDRVLQITDHTLAAVPFDPLLIQACSDETSTISRWGIEYVQSLDTVLMSFGGVRYAATFTVEANGNSGVTNV
jgi:hypothetical protein